MTEPRKPAGRKAWKENLCILAGIVVLGAILYARTLHVPFYLDDYEQIATNPAVLNLAQGLRQILSNPRGLVTLTFALNYHYGGMSLAGFHLVNIGIHLVASCLVYLLFKRVFLQRPLLALGGASIFIAHPLQTQAVTYLTQRAACLAGLCFFLAFYLYVRARERVAMDGAWRAPSALFYSGALIGGALAVLAKQNAAILPLALLLFDRYFLTPRLPLPWRRLFLWLAPFAVVPLWLGIQTLLLPMFGADSLRQIVPVTRLAHLQHLTPINYLFTEFSVVWLYLRLLIAPYGQALDYDLPIVATFWSVKSAFALLGIVLLLVAATIWRKRWPRVSAGVFWFFLGLAVESTLIPLDPVFEHRLYVPMFGFALVVMGGLETFPRRTALAAIVLVVGTLSLLTWQRNALWNDPLAFYADNLRRAPRSERVHLGLANSYLQLGRVEEGQHLLEQALQINPDYAQLYVSLSQAYSSQGRHSEALAALQEGLRRAPNDYRLYIDMAVSYTALGDFRAAADILQQAIRLQPDSAEAHLDLGVAYHRLNLLDRAIAEYRQALGLKYRPPFNFYFNLGMALVEKGEFREALPAFEACYRLNPDHPGVLFNLAVVSVELGEWQTARNFADRLQQVDKDLAGQFDDRLKARFPAEGIYR